jgi:hypothetical protein
MRPYLRPAPLRTLTATVLAALAVAGCGGSSQSSSTSKHTTASPAATSTPAGGSSTITSGPVRGSFTGQDHAPRANKPWAYSLKVSGANGQPLAGTVDIAFTFGGQVVGHDSPPTHPVKHGRWHETLTFPAQAIGQALSVQAVVHTSLGSITLDWPVTVH